MIDTKPILSCPGVWHKLTVHKLIANMATRHRAQEFNIWLQYMFEDELLTSLEKIGQFIIKKYKKFKIKQD